MLPNSLRLNTSSAIRLYFCALHHLLPFFSLWFVASTLIIYPQRFKTFLGAGAPLVLLYGNAPESDPIITPNLKQ